MHYIKTVQRNSSSAFSLSKNKLMGMFWYAKNARALDQLYGKPISVTIPESLIPFKCIRCSQKYSIRNLQRATSQKNELLQRRFSNLLAAVAKQLFWWTLSVAASLINSLQMLQQIIKNTTFLFCDKFFSLWTTSVIIVYTIKKFITKRFIFHHLNLFHSVETSFDEL